MASTSLRTTILVLTVAVLARISHGFYTPVECTRLPNLALCKSGGQAAQPVRGNGTAVPSNGTAAPSNGTTTTAAPMMVPNHDKVLTPEETAIVCQQNTANYQKRCVPATIMASNDIPFCDLHARRCLGAAGPAPGAAQVAPSAAQPALPVAAAPQSPPATPATPPPPPPPTPPPTAGPAVPQAWWPAATQQGYQQQQMQQAAATNNWLNNCGNYNAQYNSQCLPNVQSSMCNAIRQACLSNAQNAAAGQTPVGGPFAFNNGLPPGGAGSVRPLSWGNSINVGPLFKAGQTTAFNPLEGFGKSTQIGVPAAGLDATVSNGLDYGGLFGVNQLGQMLGRRRRRRMAMRQTG